MKSVLSIACMCWLAGCVTLPPSPLKVCPVRWLMPADGNHREVTITLYSREW